MLAMIQRIARGRVLEDGEILADCPGKGLLILLGVTTSDTEDDGRLLAEKIAKLRIFSDEEGKMNLSVTDVDGEVLCVSQFTLCAYVKKGNRLSFSPSAPPVAAGFG